MDKYTEDMMMNIPVYMDYATLRSSVKIGKAQELVKPGKICFKDNYLLIVEYREGIHVIDVSNPSNPQNKVFIEIPGCVDIAVKDNSLYADSYVDLITIDLSDINNPKEKNRLKDVLPYAVPTAENENYPFASVDQESGVVVAWEAKREKRELERRYFIQYPRYYDYRSDVAGYYYGTLSSNSGSVSGGAQSSFGKSGSMARFALYDQYLYIADTYTLCMFYVGDADTPAKSGSMSVGGNTETIFAYDDHLFFGTTTGMLVYNLKVPNTPAYVQSFWHITSCDPVVVQDGYAYVTLRGGTECRNNTVNRLDVIRCSEDYKQLTLVNSYNMVEPFGLGIDGNMLFLCDGNAGLKVYDVTVKNNISIKATFPNIQTYDVIPVGGYLFMIGSDGFYLYDYSDINNIRAVGHIPVAKI